MVLIEVVTMAKNNESTMKWKVDISQLKSAMQDAKRSISLANAEFKAATAGMDKWQTSANGLEAKLSQLNKTLPQQKSILQQLQKQYAIVADTLGEDSAEAQRLKIQIENQKAAVNKTEASINTYTKKLKEMQVEESSLTNTVKKQETELESLKKAYVDAVGQYGKHSKEAKSLANQIETLSGSLADNKKILAEASESANEYDKSLNNVSDASNQASESTSTLSGGFTVLKGVMAGLVVEGINMVVDGLAKLGQSMIDTGKQAIASYADYEQLVGGIESMFGGIENGSEQIDKVLEMSAKAWENLTMSQNDYFTAFSSTYPLMKTDIEDQNEAIDATNRLMTLNSDLANTFGYSFETAANAVNWALKGSFNYIDNLNIGIKGTQEGFLEAAKDAGYMVDDVKELSSADILDILEKTADKYGVLGKSAEEASTTITGSLNMTKAAWSNLLVGMADDGADFDALLEDFMSAVTNFGTNIIPRLKTTVSGIGKTIVGLLEKFVPEVLGMIPDLVKEGVPQLVTVFKSIGESLKKTIPEILAVVPGLIKSLMEEAVNVLPGTLQFIIDTIVSILNSSSALLEDLIPMVIDLVMQLVQVIVDNSNAMLDAALSLIEALVTGIMKSMPILIKQMPKLVKSLLKALMYAMPQLIEAGVDIVITILEGFTEELPDLLNMVAKLIPEVVFTILKELPRLNDMSFKIFDELISSLGKNLPRLLKELVLGVGQCSQQIRNSFANYDWLSVGKTIINGIKDGVVNTTENLFSIINDIKSKFNSIGSDMVKGMWEGISGSKDWIKDKINGWTGDVLQFFKDAFGIKSPSKAMRDQVGKWLTQGVAEGVEADMPSSLQDMKTTINGAMNELKTDISNQSSNVTSSSGSHSNNKKSGSSTQNVTFNQTINSAKPVDNLTLYRETNNLLFSSKVRLGHV